MDISPYLSALSKVYRLKKLPEQDGCRIWQVRKRGIRRGTPFFLAFFDLFYLPENEHKMREALSHMPLPPLKPWQTPKILVLCSYNGMVDLTQDDLRSFTKEALINYLLLWRDRGIWMGADTFYRGDSDEPRQVRLLLTAVTAQAVQPQEES